MAKTRLTSGAKSALRAFAGKHVDVPAVRKARSVAYQRVVRLLRPIIEKKFPPEDMALLEKYDVARRDSCVRCVHENGRVVEFDFEISDAPLLPSKYCSSRRFVLTTRCLDAIDSYGLSETALENALSEIRDKYFAVIEASRYVEDVIEVWPASQSVLAPYMHQLPVAVSEETLAFIRKNNAGAHHKEAA